MTPMKKHTNGNVLIYLLIALALLGGLTYVLSKTASNTQETGQKEKNRIIAERFIRDGATFKSVVDKLLLSGCSIHEISFESFEEYPEMGMAPYGMGDFTNASAPSDKRCHFFNKNGGGMSALAIRPPAQTGSVYHNYYFFSRGLRTSYHGDPNKFELTVYTSVSNQALCLEINKLLGIVDPSDTPWYLAGSHVPSGYNGLFMDQVGGWQMPVVGDSRIQGKNAFCIAQPDRDPPNHHLFIYVLYPR
jgi:hypothetical protein